MIKIPMFYRMRIAEYLTYSNRIFKLISESVSESITFEPFKSRIKNGIEKLEKATEKVNTQLLTINVAERDARRDQAFAALEYFAMACSKRLDAEISESGKIILNEIDSLGSGIVRKPMLEESAIINGMIEKMKTVTKLANALQKMNGADWLDELESAQTDFEASVAKRDEAKTERNDDDSVVACKQIKKEFEAFYKYLDVMCDIETDAAYSNLAKEINIVTEETNNIIAQRVGRSTTDEEVVVE
ncbi:DUF6261 family protein [Marinifilum sp. D714]|uniref:DUF6261 family protein n=1 Tax=Marinifilum sp. D714 TaxID=2937523 RepID=UPI0027CB5C4C|nr:DUF6261 family protein [Marinifilum sp. D714]MDQ2179614.1 DUF6261 family protein [Marinifilum sp. D714]